MHTNPIKFIDHYLMPPNLLTPLQQSWLQRFMSQRVTELGFTRASGRTTTLVGLTSWLTTFRPATMTVIVTANQRMGLLLRSRLLQAYLTLPTAAQPTIVTTANLGFQNGARVMITDATRAIRGHTIDNLLLDNFEAIKLLEQRDLVNSLWPALTINSKVMTTGENTEWVSLG